jgi:hypothetical protein
MYTCERCGTRFGQPDSLPGSCPRCLARDGVRVALSFRLFEDEEANRDGPRLPEGSEVEMRRGLATGAPAAGHQAR